MEIYRGLAAGHCGHEELIDFLNYVFGMNGADSYRFDSLLVETAGTALPIRRPNETVFQFTVPNPHPESEIVSVRVVKTAPDDGAIRLIALKACPGEA